MGEPACRNAAATLAARLEPGIQRALHRLVLPCLARMLVYAHQTGSVSLRGTLLDSAAVIRPAPLGHGAVVGPMRHMHRQIRPRLHNCPLRTLGAQLLQSNDYFKLCLGGAANMQGRGVMLCYQRV